MVNRCPVSADSHKQLRVAVMRARASRVDRQSTPVVQLGLAPGPLIALQHFGEGVLTLRETWIGIERQDCRPPGVAEARSGG